MDSVIPNHPDEFNQEIDTGRHVTAYASSGFI